MRVGLLIVGWGMHGWGAGGWIAMGVTMVLLWILVAWAILTIVGRGSDARSSPEDLLKRRLARGDVTVEEYERRRRILRGDEDRPAAT